MALYATIQTHKVMSEFTRGNFEDHPVVCAELTHFLVTRMGSGDNNVSGSDYLRTKADAEKAKADIGKIHQRLDSVNSKLDVLAKRVDTLGKK